MILNCNGSNAILNIKGTYKEDFKVIWQLINCLVSLNCKNKLSYYLCTSETHCLQLSKTTFNIVYDISMSIKLITYQKKIVYDISNQNLFWSFNYFKEYTPLLRFLYSQIRSKAACKQVNMKYLYWNKLRQSDDIAHLIIIIEIFMLRLCVSYLVIVVLRLFFFFWLKENIRIETCGSISIL